MTDPASAQEENVAFQAPADPVVPGTEAAARAADRPPKSASKPHRRGRSLSRAADPAPQNAPNNPPRPPRPVHPVLEQLAGLYPGLFGEVFLPLKRGIFQDLLAAHPEVLEREALKTALAVHTRSTRYLQSVAAGHKRHDLRGQAVEDMAPEHIHHALLEVFRRRQARAGEDLRPKLRARIIQTFEASGLSREAYAERVHARDEAANALLDEALAEAASRAAKDEALLRAFEAARATVAQFADMYGMDHRVAAQTLERARRRRPAASA